MAKDGWGDQTLASYRRHGCYLKDHRDFYESLSFFLETERYFFCHAGVRPGIALDKQKNSDYWKSENHFFHRRRISGRLFVHGHERVEEPTILPHSYQYRYRCRQIRSADGDRIAFHETMATKMKHLDIEISTI